MKKSVVAVTGICLAVTAGLLAGCLNKGPTIYLLGGSHGCDYSESKDYIIQPSSISDEVKKAFDLFDREPYIIRNLCDKEQDFSDMVNNGEYSSITKKITEEDVVVVYLDGEDMKNIVENEEEINFLTGATEAAACVILFPPYNYRGESEEAAAYSDKVKEIAEDGGMYYDEYVAKVSMSSASDKYIYPIYWDKKRGETGYDLTAYNRCGNTALAFYIMEAMSEAGVIDGSFFEEEVTEENTRALVDVSGREFVYNIMRCAGLATAEEEALSRAEELGFTKFENKGFIPEEIISNDEVVVITCRIMDYLGYKFGELSCKNMFMDSLEPYYTEKFDDFAKADAWRLVREGRYVICGGLNISELFTIYDMYDFVYEYAGQSVE